jgi:predicted phage tail protein
VHLTWEPPVSDGNGNITEYRVYRGLASGSETLYATVNASTLNFTDTNVSNGVAYYYYVSAVNEFGESESSNEVSAVPCTVPSPPRNLTAIAGNGSVALSWEPPVDDGGMAVTNYTIYYGTNSGNYTMNMTVGNITSYTITGLSNGQRYYFAVSAINSVGEGEKSAEVSVVPCTVPSAPQNLTAVAGNGNVTLTWEPPADNGGMPITGYRIYYGTTARNYTVNITVSNVTAYTIMNLTNGQKYYFSVSAINGGGEGAKSNEVSATPRAEPNPTPGFDVLAYIYAGVVCIGIIMLVMKKRR